MALHMEASTALAIAQQHALLIILPIAHLTRHNINVRVMHLLKAVTQLGYKNSKVLLVLSTHDGKHITGLKRQNMGEGGTQLIKLGALKQQVFFVLDRAAPAGADAS